MTISAPPQNENAPTTARSSLLGALVVVARHRGLHLNAPDLIRDHRLGPGEPSLDELLKVARSCGLRAMVINSRWGDLMRMGAALPAILLLNNGRALVLLRANK